MHFHNYLIKLYANLKMFIAYFMKVNPHFAIDLINAIPPKPVKDRVVWCDGGGGALGHPKVYINLVSNYEFSYFIYNVLN